MKIVPETFLFTEVLLKLRNIAVREGHYPDLLKGAIKLLIEEVMRCQ